jgi:hypothetical protein
VGEVVDECFIPDVDDATDTWPWNPVIRPDPRIRPLPDRLVRPSPVPTPTLNRRPAPTPQPTPPTNPGRGPVPVPLSRLSPEPTPTSSPTQRVEPNWVVRAGIATPEQLQKGVAQHRDIPGLHGFSVQSEPGHTIPDLAAAGQFPNAQISVSSVEALVRAGASAGYNIQVVKSPGRGYHRTVQVPDPLPYHLAQALSEAFTQMPNPARVRR